jgi:hypothetical protein
LTSYRKNVESLSEKVDSITEELKMKDKLLEKIQAKVSEQPLSEQPLALSQDTHPSNIGPPLPPRSPPPNLIWIVEEDIYMEENTVRETEKKVKGKGWQVEDVGAEDSDTGSELDDKVSVRDVVHPCIKAKPTAIEGRSQVENIGTEDSDPGSKSDDEALAIDEEDEVIRDAVCPHIKTKPTAIEFLKGS